MAEQICRPKTTQLLAWRSKPIFGGNWAPEHCLSQREDECQLEGDEAVPQAQL